MKALPAIALLLALLAAACTRTVYRTAEVPQISRDTSATVRTVHDSVFVAVDRSVERSGDSVVVTRTRIVRKVEHHRDTVLKVRRDTVTVAVEVPAAAQGRTLADRVFDILGIALLLTAAVALGRYLLRQ